MIRHTVNPARQQAPIDATPFNLYTFDDGTVWTEFYRSPDGYLLRFPDLADFEVSTDGKQVVAHPTPETDETTVEHLYQNQLVPLALSRQGRPAFHASVVSMADGAVAFLGLSGRGKSTLAASFALDDSAFLTDDALLIEEIESACLALPSHASIRLWEDSVSALMHSDISRNCTVSFSDKAKLFAGDVLTYSGEALPLIAAFVLRSDDAQSITIEALEGAERQMSWINNSFLLDIEDAALLTAHFDWTHRISQKVPTFSLDYPRDYGILPDVRSAILSHVEAAGS